MVSLHLARITDSITGITDYGLPIVLATEVIAIFAVEK